MDFFCNITTDDDQIVELIVPAFTMTKELLDSFSGICAQQLNRRYYAIYTTVQRFLELPKNAYFYGFLPKLYGEVTTSALEVSGISKLQNQPILGLRGQGVLIGIADSGIDFTHPAFLDSSGRTRILYLWDQTDSSGTPPEGVSYGTEYTADEINRALATSDPKSLVPSTDESGHGTHMAGVAGGSEDIFREFCGAAPDAQFIIVKLKSAGNFLRDYYFVSRDVPAYQENDIMLALWYLRQKHIDLRLPIAIPLGLGSGLGGHSGSSALDFSIDSVSFYPGSCVCLPTGNEGLSAGHFRGLIESSAMPVTMELFVNSGVPGIVLEIFGQEPATLTVSIESPTGEILSRIPVKVGPIEEYSLLFEQTKISVYYTTADSFAGNELIFLRLTAPTEGVWRFHVYSDMSFSVFHAYLAGRSLIGNSAYFLKPDPDGTLTDPSGAGEAITVSGYDSVTNAFYQNSGRGFTRLERYKPDLCAPCVSLTVPRLNGGYEERSGTSLGAALTAGACAQFLTWAVTYGNFPYLTAGNIKTYLIRGAARRPSVTYPSKLWGYGTLDIYNSFEVLRRSSNT